MHGQRTVGGSLQGDLSDLGLGQGLGFLEKFLRFSGKEYWAEREREREREREQEREMGETGRDEGKWMRKWMNDEGKANWYYMSLLLLLLLLFSFHSLN